MAHWDPDPEPGFCSRNHSHLMSLRLVPRATSQRQAGTANQSSDLHHKVAMNIKHVPEKISDGETTDVGLSYCQSGNLPSGCDSTSTAPHSILNTDQDLTSNFTHGELIRNYMCLGDGTSSGHTMDFNQQTTIHGAATEALDLRVIKQRDSGEGG
ncbi:unnamed protein product [Pleuronectes platessa]|uniref:Uncharacterized protein n=1 Tax=Pleuronectes platessa TaxID=8262 RepID=A0A9N7YBB2_PLEPL|nr:unnamed protein product [Pleuronectes platessa]